MKKAIVIAVTMPLMLGATCVFGATDSSHYTIHNDSIMFGPNTTDDDLLVLDEHPDLRTVTIETMAWDGPDPRAVPIKITNRGFAVLARCRKLQTLRLSSLQPLQVTDEALKSLSGLTELRVLELGVTPFSSEGLSHLGGLPNLEEIWLDFNPQYNDTAIDTIAKFKKLRVLRCYGAPITDKGVAKLAGLSRLEDLQLGKSQVGDEGVKIIANLSRLRTLDLQYTRVTDAGMSHLRSLRQLHWLCVKGTAVTRTGLALLSDLPELDSLYLDESQAKNVPSKLATKLKGNAQPTPAGEVLKAASEE